MTEETKTELERILQKWYTCVHINIDYAKRMREALPDDANYYTLFIKQHNVEARLLENMAFCELNTNLVAP